MKQKLMIFIIFILVLITTGCNSKEIDELNKQINDLTEEKELLEKENSSLQKDNEVKQEEIDYLKEENEIKEEIINKLNKDNVLLKDEIEMLFNGGAVEKEWLEVIRKILSSGMTLDEYTKFKEKYSLINSDSYYRELFDRIYYCYNNYDSLSFFSKLAEYNGMELVETSFSTSKNDIRFHENNIIFLTIRFFDSEVQKKMYLKDSKEYEGRNYAFGNNFCVIPTANYEEVLNRRNLQKLGEYIKSLIESDEFVNKEECYNKLLEIKEENNYSVGISSIDYAGLSTYYWIIQDNKATFRITILRSEYDLDSFEYYLNQWFSEEVKKDEYSKHYLFGRIAIMPGFTEEFDYLKETDIYKYVTENGINAYEYYLNNK